MELRRCAACDQAFRPRSQFSVQCYCAAPVCQRERRRRWQRAKRRSDPDYRDNQARAQRAWQTRNPDYWREYSPKTIADKTGLTLQYVQGILTLLQHGEERLLVAVKKGRVADEIVVDLIFRTCGETFDTLATYAQVIDLDGVPVRTVSLAGLLRTKQSARARDVQDRAVIERALAAKGRS